MRALFGNSSSLLALGCLVVVALFVVMNFSGPDSGTAPSDSGCDSAPIQERLNVCEEVLSSCQGSGQARPKPILKRAVVIAANENPFYSFFTPMVAWTWKHRIGVDVIAIMTRNVPKMIVEATRWAGGIPVLVDITWPSGTGKMMQNVRTIAAAIRDQIDNNTILTTGDADMFPLNKSYFAIPEDMNNKLIVHGNHPGTLGMNQYPLCYLSMTAKHWRDIMDLKELTLNEALVRMYIEHSAAMQDIYFDQDYFYRQVQKYRAANPAFGVTLVPWDNSGRLDFRVWRDFNFDSQPMWLDSPALRPGFTKANWPRFKQGLLRHIFDADTLAYFEKFKDDYLQDVMRGDDEAKGLRDGFGRESRSLKQAEEEDAYLNRPVY